MGVSLARASVFALQDGGRKRGEAPADPRRRARAARVVARRTLCREKPSSHTTRQKVEMEGKTPVSALKPSTKCAPPAFGCYENNVRFSGAFWI